MRGAKIQEVKIEGTPVGMFPRCSEASDIQNKVGVAQKISDAELIALLCQAQDEIEAQGRSNEAPELLADFGTSPGSC